MNRNDFKQAKKNILKCLTEDFEYGTKKDGTPLKHKKTNYAIFDKEDGRRVYYDMSLEDIMDAVVLGLMFTVDDKLSEK